MKKRGLAGRPEENNHLEGLKSRWKDKIKMKLQGARCGGMDWIRLICSSRQYQQMHISTVVYFTPN
jgi:hypothetical protein